MQSTIVKQYFFAYFNLNYANKSKGYFDEKQTINYKCELN